MSDILNQTVSEAEVTRRSLVDLRRRIANNEAIPEEELAENLMKIRQAYGSEAKATQAKATKAKKAAPKKKVNADDLLGDLLGGL